MLFRIAVDCIIVTYDHQENALKVLLVNRLNEPEKGKWALPGGFVSQTEEFLETAEQKLLQETGVQNVFLEQLQAYSLTDQSVDNRIVSIAFYALLRLEEYCPTPQHSHITQWFPFKQMPVLPFDHAQKVRDTLNRIRESVEMKPLAFQLLPAKFPLNQLQKFYEELYEVPLDNRNFRKKIKSISYIEELEELEANVSHRPGKLYRFNPEKYQAYSRQVRIQC